MKTWQKIRISMEFMAGLIGLEAPCEPGGSLSVPVFSLGYGPVGMRGETTLHHPTISNMSRHKT